MKIAVSYLKIKDSKEKTIKEIEATSCDYIHVDLTDGKFVPQKNFTWNDTHELLKHHQKPLDIHLMTCDLEKNIEESIKLKPEFITFHPEAAHKNLFELIKKVKNSGSKVGLALNLETDINILTPFLKEIDLILVMSIKPGKGGQSFIMAAIDKMKSLQKIRNDYNILISVDGGINETTIKYVKPYVDIAVSGSFVCLSDNFETQIQKLR